MSLQRKLDIDDDLATAGVWSQNCRSVPTVFFELHTVPATLFRRLLVAGFAYVTSKSVGKSGLRRRPFSMIFRHHPCHLLLLSLPITCVEAQALCFLFLVAHFPMFNLSYPHVSRLDLGAHFALFVVVVPA